MKRITYTLQLQVFSIAVALLLQFHANGQDLSNNVKLYNTLGIDLGLNAKDKLSLSGTMIGDAVNGNFEYFQFGLGYTRKLGKKTSVEAGFDAIQIKEPGNSFKKYYRGSLGIMYQHKLQWFQLSHGLEAEYFMPAFTKFKSRYSVETEITTRKSWTGLHIRPFTKFKLYYYKGGAYLSYYDEGGDLLAKKSADDIHRWRWFGGIKMRIHSSVSARICYFWNEEFNAGLGTNSDINIYNKSKTAIRQPFNSYGAISTAITITL